MLLTLLFMLLSLPMLSQTAGKGVYRGVVLEDETGEPLPGVHISIPDYGILATTDAEGRFNLKELPLGKARADMTFIGMLPIHTTLTVAEKMEKPVTFRMKPENLSIQEVQVVATNNKVGLSTASSISRAAMDHLQATNLGAVMELLPGHLATNPSLNSPSHAVMRQVQSDAMNSMGTSVVFNGAPVSNNANLQIGNTAQQGALNTGFTSSAGNGLDLRQIPADNIESVDIIRGIPSVEYGDLTSGVIIVNPKAGVYPVQVKGKLNPTLTQASVGKGFALGKRWGTLDMDMDYTHSLADERRPNQGYQRITGNLLYTRNFTDQLYTTTSLRFYTDLDATKLDPSDARYQRERKAQDIGFKFNTNMVWNNKQGVLKYIKWNVALDYAHQTGYNQEIQGNFGYMVTSAMQDGAITSNRDYEILGYNGQAITNINGAGKGARTNILPYEFLTQMTTDGKPLNFYSKVLASFLKEWGITRHRMLAGADWKTDVNFGQGKVFDPLMPPTKGLRMRPYTDIPAMNQLSAYAEENMTMSLWNRELSLQAGVRADDVQPGRKENQTVVTPRFNASLDIVPHILSLKGGWGITAKAPPLMYLYPEKAFYDFVNYDNLGNTALNDNQKLSIITTRVYDTVTHKLKMATNRKAEVGMEVHMGQATLDVTAYREKLKNGYSYGLNYSSFRSFELVKYRTSEERTNSYPLLSVDKTSTVITSFQTPLNDKESENQGVEFDLTSGLIRPLRTTLVFNGAYMQSRLYSTEYQFYQKSPDTDGTYKDIGVYAAGDGTDYRRFSTTLRVVHNIPCIRMVISLAVQTVWHDSQRYLGTENKTPIAYISAKDLSWHDLAQGDEIKSDWQKPILAYREVTESYPPLWLVNLRATKEFKKYGGLAFFVNNLFNHNPLQESKRQPGTFIKRNPEQFFGAEVWFKI